jgi:hypothetical protein
MRMVGIITRLFSVVWLLISFGVDSCLAFDPLEAVFNRTGVSRSSVKVENHEAATIPVIDAHNHLNANMGAETLIKAMEKAGVKRMVLMPRHYTRPEDGGLGSDEQALEYARRFPDRFIPFIGGQRDDLGPKSRIWDGGSDLYFLQKEMETKLKTGEFFGLGEFILVHHAYEITNTAETGGEVRIPADSRDLKGVAKLAARYQVPVLFHAEAEPQVLKEVVRLIEGAQDTRFIWAHN